MQFREGVHVYSADNKDVGRIERVVIDPLTHEISHVVVRQGLIFSEDKVISIELFHTATPDRAVLRQDIDNLQKLPRFEETHYVPLHEAEAGETDPQGTPGGMLYWYPPVGLASHHAQTLYGTPAYPAIPRQYYTSYDKQQIPEGTIALKEGARVFSADGEHVGEIERVIVEAENNDATHILLTQGLLLKDRKLIPTAWFSRVEEDEIHLAVNSQMIESLPEYTEA